ncbi:RNA polymerase sigma factor SigJ [Xylanimonas protaetiae]|uniref:Sigma-70 family RNA polymerase sigma factor n=1 Tax=Xylanimonas protaetiae TaxID=2509457 RepID=A0A4P6F5Y8_9MICO|nr:RNA polymerase sigma factor SigJ [Xylanimonas protaetiae]QAY71034.1 sigma-70 family RNA polymerase sigma factor [Xylanimonas protaetiae]
MPTAVALDQAVPDDDVAAFLAIRPRLFGVAYRMLGSAAEADDVVQDAWLRWQRTDRSLVVNPAAFLTTATTRLAINALTSARARRETYVGPWFPEPVDTSADPFLGAERAEALDLAVLTLMEKLSPAERAAYVLREAFGYSHREVADALETSEANARQLARRARLALAADRPADRAAAPPERRRELLEAFVAAAHEGRVADLERLLARDVVMRNDGGGKVHAARKPVVGIEAVLAVLEHAFARWWPADAVAMEVADLNGAPAVRITDRAGAVVGVLWCDADDALRTICTQVNPDKLAHLTR